MSNIMEFPENDLVSMVEDCSDVYVKRALHKFKNGLELSVVRGSGTYGSEYGLYEIAVYNSKGDWITQKVIEDAGDDVVGWQSEADVLHLIETIGSIDPTTYVGV